MQHEQARLAQMVSGYDRPDPAEDEHALSHDAFVAQLGGAIVFRLSIAVKEELERWISGVQLLVAASVVLLFWIKVAGPFLRWFGSPGPAMDRGWAKTWRRVNLFVGGTLSLIVVNVVTDLWSRSREDQGSTPYEVPLNLLTLIVVFFGSLHFLERVPGARAGRRTL